MSPARGSTKSTTEITIAVAVLTITDTSNVPKASAETSLGKVPPGATSVETEERVFNDLDGAGTDDARDLALFILARTSGDVWARAGIALLESRAVEVKMTQLNSVVVTEAFRSLGTGIHIRLPDLAAGEFHQYIVRARPSAGPSEVVTDFKVAFEEIRFITFANPAGAPRGIQRGIGEGRTTAILTRSAAIGVTGIETFEWPDYAWVHEGLPHSVLEHDETIDDASATSTLISGESYAYRAVLNGTTTTIIKGDTITGTAAFGDLPGLPVGDRFLGWGVRDFTVDLTFPPLDALPDFFTVTSSGLNFTVARAGVGVALLTEGKLIDPTTPVGGSLTANETNTVQQLQDGSAAVTIDDSLFEVGAMILVDITTGGSGETSRVERRKWAPGRPIVFDLGTVGNNQEAVWRNTLSRKLYVRSDMVSAQVTAAFGADTAGLLKFDLLVKEDGVAEVSLFTSFPSPDRRPGWDFGDSNEVDFGLPEKLDIPANALLICRATMTLDVSSPTVVVSIETDEE